MLYFEMSCFVGGSNAGLFLSAVVVVLVGGAEGGVVEVGAEAEVQRHLSLQLKNWMQNWTTTTSRYVCVRTAFFHNLNNTIPLFL